MDHRPATHSISSIQRPETGFFPFMRKFSIHALHVPLLSYIVCVIWVDTNLRLRQWEICEDFFFPARSEKEATLRDTLRREMPAATLTDGDDAGEEKDRKDPIALTAD